MHPDRDVLFSNESFVIGMLQAVSGGSVVAALAQSSQLTALAGKLSLLLLLSGALLALSIALTAAYLKHQYKMWDVKRQAEKANSRLWAMRRCMLGALLIILASIAQLIVFAWMRAVQCSFA
jgi:uncharacterized membrane protein YhfC